MRPIILVIPGQFARPGQQECSGARMQLLSDNKRHTCTDVTASKFMISYTCASLIKDQPQALIKYCPVEVCMANGTWSEPSISCALSECYNAGRSREYKGRRTCTKSGRPCQRWDAQEPNRHRFRDAVMFPEASMFLADNFCRDPDDSRGAPWCFTEDLDRTWEYCDVTECGSIPVFNGFCGYVPTPEESVTEVTETVEEEVGTTTATTDTCSNDIEFKIVKEHKINGKAFKSLQLRSIVECSSKCAQESLCRGFSFSSLDGVCLLHDSYQDIVRSGGYRAGMKMCL
ncbi:plasminogen-like [Dreissena polymorpha]|uniref:plasminogen-like n=1 Tax=Dreissena polymorpha TaxID=45954 RepID=UPI00226406C3|nr:plasminogen-like [Dreissena polymorpha]